MGEPSGIWDETFHDWVKQGATGCVFAQRRSMSPDHAQWLGIRVNSPPEQRELDGLQSVLEAASDPQAILLAFPEAVTLESVGELVSAFHEHPAWACETVPKNAVQPDGFQEVGIRWLLPHSKYRSEAIGFGPFEEFPVTRQAPVTALAFRTHPPTEPEKDNRVHLAQMPFDDRESEDWEKFWKRTQELRSDLLNDVLEHAARARVTWRLPESIAAVAGLIRPT